MASGYSLPVRIALVSPYSWTYPGGVTRHIEALAVELEAAGQEARILAPFDPDDALAWATHRGARPQSIDPPRQLVRLGRTMGFPANGAISNLAATPDAVLALWRELRSGGYDVVHIHEPIVPLAHGLCMASGCAAGVPLVGTFHSFSENSLTNGIGIGLGGRRRMNRLHARIAVSEAAAWTARRFFGGRYTIIPNGVNLLEEGEELGRGERGTEEWDSQTREPVPGEPLRILFIGQAVERKGLPVLLRAFEALREHVPATLTLVGAGPQDVAPLLLDDRGVVALGKVTEERKAQALAQAQVLCAPSLGGESFGMVLTEAFAAGTPVVASDIAGYRDVVRDGVDGVLTPRGDARALAEALRGLALQPQRRVAMARAACERECESAFSAYGRHRRLGSVLEVYEQARAVGRAPTRLGRVAVRHGVLPADLLPVVPARRLASLEPALRGPAGPRGCCACLLAGGAARGGFARGAVVGPARAAADWGGAGDREPRGLQSRTASRAGNLGVRIWLPLDVRAGAWRGTRSCAPAPTWTPGAPAVTYDAGDSPSGDADVRDSPGLAWGSPRKRADRGAGRGASAVPARRCRWCSARWSPRRC